MTKSTRALNHLKVAGKTVGLHGLEHAISAVLTIHKQKTLTPDDAAALLLDHVTRTNYVPEKAKNAYFDALKRLWSIEIGIDDATDDYLSGDEAGLRVRILGAGCISCKNIERIILEAAAKKGLAVDILHVTDPDQIALYGAFNTPAVVINDRLVSAGKYPTPVQIDMWLDEAAKL